VLVCAVAVLVYLQYREPGPEPLPAAVSTAEPAGTPSADTTIVKTPEPGTETASSAKSVTPADSPAPAPTAESTPSDKPAPAAEASDNASPDQAPAAAPSTEIATAEPGSTETPNPPSPPADVNVPADASAPGDQNMPSFDIVRVEPTGDTVVAGQAAPKARVEILDGSQTIATAEANEFGEWAIPLEKPLPPGTHDLAIRTTSSDQKVVTLSDQRVAVSVPSNGSKDVLVVLNSPDAASKVLQEPPAQTAGGVETKPEGQAPQVAAADESKPADKPAAVASAETSGAGEAPTAKSGEGTGAETVIAETPAPSGEQQQAAAGTAPSSSDQAAAPAAESGGSAPAADQQASAGSSEQGAPAPAEEKSPPAGASGAATETSPPSDQTAAETTKPEAPAAEATKPEAPAAEAKKSDTEIAAVQPEEKATLPVATPKPADEATAAPEEPAATPQPSPAAETPAPKPAPVVEAPPPPEVDVATVEADTSGAIYVSGSSNGTATVRVYMDDKLLGDAKPDASGKWTLQAMRDMPAGLYQLRADQIGGDGQVIARAEVPFEREVEVAILKPVAGAGAASGTKISGAMPQTQTVVIKRGDNLWRLSRTWYGKGKRWATLYTANKDQIRNPRWIYPGQVFMVPTGDLTWKN
jgi:nucleoid-associated protein YgaU